MRCTACNHPEDNVIDSRESADGLSIRRRRECKKCNNRWTTYEWIEKSPILVTKADGTLQEFDPDKLMHGLLTATVKRSIDQAKLDNIIAQVELEIRSERAGRVTSKQIGKMMLKHLRKVDQVAYVRFASVHQDFQNIDEFSEIISKFGAKRMKVDNKASVKDKEE